MTEAKIVFPLAEEDGRSLQYAHDWLARELCDRFNGYTATDAVGAWRDDRDRVITEPVRVYIVAGTPFTVALHVPRIVAHLLRVTDQDAVYSVANGCATITNRGDV